MSEKSRFKGLQRIGRQALLLGGFATAAAVLLVGINQLTTKPIANRLAEDLRASLNQVVPKGSYDNNLLSHPLKLKDEAGNPVLVYRGMRNGRVSAIAWELSGQGYAGEIRLIMGVTADGSILGVRVLSHSETPGLGDKIEEKKSDWITHFSGRSLQNPTDEKWKVKKDGGVFDQFSGATITPRGVVAAIHKGLQFFQTHRLTLLIPPDEDVNEGPKE